jgi:addiction module HigA family antidote
MSQTDLANRMGRPQKTINEIIKGKAAITPETALQLEKVLNLPARFWLNREQQYRESLARQAEHEALETRLGWLDEIPVNELVQRKMVALDLQTQK